MFYHGYNFAEIPSFSNDVSRERRAALILKWRSKGGVFLMGYTAFRNLALGKQIKDRQVAKEISEALQVLLFL